MPAPIQTPAPARSKSVAALIDALLSYAIDPAQWEDLATELETHGPTLASIDPAEFLTSLSHAESLAWQMKNEADDVVPPNYVYLLLDQTDRVVASSENLSGLSDYLWPEANSGRLCLADEQSRLEFEAAKRKIADRAQGHLLLELRARDQPHRYGYLVGEANFPSVLKLTAPTATRALMVAEDKPSDKLRRVVQASFGLTSAEAAVALKLAGGIRLKDAAESLNISINTARNHLQSVFDKSGIKRQSDLILVITQLSVILAATVAPEAETTTTVELTDADYPAYEFALTPDGRRLAYRCYGDGNRHVLYFHETIGGSRLPPGTDALARERDLTILALERPGAGFSDPVVDYGFDAVARDVEHLLTSLGIESVTLLGFVSGAAHALYCAGSLGTRVDHVMTVAGRTPSRYQRAGLDALYSLRSHLTRQPWLLKTFFNILRNRTSIEMNRRLLRRIYGAVPHDAALLENVPWLMPHMASYAMESMAVSANGMVSEIQCFASGAPAPAKSAARVTVWHGDADVLSSLDAMRGYLADIEHSERIFEGAGSLILFEHWEEILDVLAA